MVTTDPNNGSRRVKSQIHRSSIRILRMNSRTGAAFPFQLANRNANERARKKCLRPETMKDTDANYGRSRYLPRTSSQLKPTDK